MMPIAAVVMLLSLICSSQINLRESPPYPRSPTPVAFATEGIALAFLSTFTCCWLPRSPTCSRSSPQRTGVCLIAYAGDLGFDAIRGGSIWPAGDSQGPPAKGNPMKVLNRSQIHRTIRVECTAEAAEQLREWGTVSQIGEDLNTFELTVYDDVSFPSICKLLLVWQEESERLNG